MMSDESHRPDEDEIAPGDDTDDLLPADEPASVREALRRCLKTEGAQVAVDTMLAVCKDSKAQASARATCAVGLLRAAGYLSKRAEEEDESEGKPIGQMTAAEMDRELARLRIQRRRLNAIIAQGENEPEDGGPSGEDDGGALD
jgi:hypothetical protein